jgi:hypothetical protein
MRRTRVSAAAATAVALALSTGCGQDPNSAAAPAPAVGSPTVITAEPSAAAAVGSPAVITAEPAAAVGLDWPTGPVEVTHRPAVPPVPVIAAVRYAGHPEAGYDRFVLDVRGSLPGYAVRYVPSVTADGSGRPIAVPGRSFLLIVLDPAQAHTDAGAVTVSGTHRIGLPMLVSYAVAGDYEGHVSIALGLAATTGFRVGELSGRVYVDVAR